MLRISKNVLLSEISYCFNCLIDIIEKGLKIPERNMKSCYISPKLTPNIGKKLGLELEISIICIIFLIGREPYMLRCSLLIFDWSY